MNLQKLLSGNNNSKLPEQRNDDMKLHVRQLSDLWCAIYYERYQTSYPIVPKDKAQFKTMIQEYGPEKTEQTLRYYLKNVDTIKYISGYPTVQALFGFRRQLYMESIHGPRSDTGKGQSTGNNYLDDIKEFNND